MLHVVALGNPAMSDDGLGPLALRVLQKKPWPRSVHFHCPDVSSLSCLELLQKPHPLLLLDALQGGYSAGTVFRLCAQHLSLNSDAFSLHELHLLHLAARFYPGRLREIIILGVEPARLAPGLELSPEVKAAFPLFLHVALLEISRLLTYSRQKFPFTGRQVNIAAVRRNKPHSSRRPLWDSLPDHSRLSSARRFL